MHFSKAGRLLLTVLLLIVCARLASGQRYLGGIQGEVSDTTGAKVSGANVTAEETSTHFKTSVKSNESGAYTFAALNPGTYTVTSTATSFGKEIRANVLVTAGELQIVNFALKAGSASETVQVEAEGSNLIDTGSANIATTLSAQQVSDLPNEGRNPYVMATMAVGVVNNGSGGYFQGKSSQYTNPFSGVAVQIGSNGNSGHNRLQLDGIPNDPPERLSGATYAGFTPSPEAVEEVKVQTTFFDAQIGHGNGTITNVVVKNGTNRLHGAAYYVFQNTYLNANTYERVPNQNGAINPASPTRRNNDQVSQTGAMFSGPVLIPHIYDGRNKTFFMVGFERYASHTAINYQSRVPTAAEAKGDFSALCTGGFDTNGLCTSGIQLYDPQSAVDVNGNRTAYFANNQIPSTRINATGAALLQYFPQPNATIANSSLNYISNQTSYPSTYPSIIGRVDHSFAGGKNVLNAIMFRAGLTQNYPMQGFPKGIGPGGYGYNVYRNTRGGSLDDVHQFSSSMVLDSRLGIVWHPFGLVYPGSSGFNLNSLSINGNGLPYQTFPGISSMSDSYATLAPGAGGQVSTSMVGSLEEVLTKTWQRHTVRFGFEGNLLHYNVQNPESGFGGYTFSRAFTQHNYANGDANSGDPVAALLLGDFNSVSYNVQIAYALSQNYYAPFVQDDWRVTPKLTVNLGLRWDYESPITDRYNRLVSGFCSTCTNPYQSGVSGLTLNGGVQYTSASNRFPYPRDLNNWQPRLGVAYQVTPTLVARAGYGTIYFNTMESPTSISTGFSQSTSNSNANANLPISSASNPFPNGIATPTGNTAGLGSGVGNGISFYDPNHATPKASEFSASVQKQLPGSLTLEVSYVYTKTTQLEVSRNLDLLPAQYYATGTDYTTNLNNQNALNAKVANPMYGHLPAGSSSSLTGSTIQQQLLDVPFPQFTSVTELGSPIGWQRYDALQVQVGKSMRHNFDLHGNFTWNKLMNNNGYLDNYAQALNQLAHVQDPGATLVAKIWGTVELPKFEKLPAYQRLVLGGWKVNTVMRAQNGSLVSAPGTVDQIGDPTAAPRNFQRFFNTCFENTTGANVATSGTSYACDSQSPNPAYRQRLSYTVQRNYPYINERQRIYPQVDLSVFKQFILRESTSFEIRGEFFNVGNRPNFGGPGTGIGSSGYGAVALTQANDPRIGQLTARINF